MSYNAKNYTEQGGDVTHIGGKLIIEEGAEVEGLPAPEVEVATEDTLGGIKAAAKGAGDTVPCKIGEDGNLYVPTYPSPSGDGHLICVFTQDESTSAWECDQEVEDIEAAFNAHTPVDGYVTSSNGKQYKVELCALSGTASSLNMEFYAPISGCNVKWHLDTWLVELPT